MRIKNDKTETAKVGTITAPKFYHGSCLMCAMHLGFTWFARFMGITCAMHGSWPSHVPCMVHAFYMVLHHVKGPY